MQDTIAMVFDFDDTLAPDTTSGLLAWLGIKDVPAFWDRQVGPLTDAGWDPVPAYLYAMVQAARQGQCRPLTREAMAEWGPNQVITWSHSRFRSRGKQMGSSRTWHIAGGVGCSM